MIDDPIVSEVRRNRATILDSHGGDLRRYHAALQQTQAGRFAGQLVTMEPRTRVEPGGPANGSQPIRSETNRTSSAAGSRR
jgi:hypothetical protein